LKRFTQSLDLDLWFGFEVVIANAGLSERVRWNVDVALSERDNCEALKDRGRIATEHIPNYGFDCSQQRFGFSDVVASGLF
jgi:hypothetical protein